MIMKFENNEDNLYVQGIEQDYHNFRTNNYDKCAMGLYGGRIILHNLKLDII